MCMENNDSPKERSDRRGFLAAAGLAGAAVIGGCATLRPAAVRAAASTLTVPGATARPVADQLPQSLAAAVRGPVLTPASPGYRAAAAVYNQRFDGIRPRAVVRPRDAVDVREVIRYTVAHDIPVRARSGGHSFAGYSTLDRGVVVDLRYLHDISVDRRAGTVTIGAGAQLIDVYAVLAAHGAALPGGSCPSVGISGVTLGGGFGLASRAFGVTADNLIAAQIVTADGSLADADADLLWALRGGGGGNFGIVTNFTFRVHPLPPQATAFEVQWPWSSAGEAIDAWQRSVPSGRSELGSTLHLRTGAAASVSAAGQYLGGAAELQPQLAALMAVPGAQLTWLETMSYLDLQYRFAGCEGLSPAACHTAGTAPAGQLPRTAFRAKSDYVSSPLGADGIAAMLSAAETAAGPGALLCDAYGGRVGEVARSETAFVHRDELFCIQYYGEGPASQWVEGAWRRMRPFVSGFAYQNYIDAELRDWRQAYYGANYPRLMATRRRVDPDHYFSFPQAIG
jgi:FAD/FMN-containing dehydrogenase